MKFYELGALRTSQCQLVFSASIGSFQGLPAETSEVILLSQRLALKYNTTHRGSCQHFLTSFFQFLCGGARLPQSKPTALTAPSEREPLAYPQTLHFSRKLYRHAKGPILEDDFPRSGGRCRAATKRGICRRRRLGEFFRRRPLHPPTKSLAYRRRVRYYMLYTL